MEIVRDVARAVEHAHGHGVIHRDLKPANVMVETSGRALVLDFGLALLGAGSRSRLTATGTAIGTPAYLPPEQADPSLGAVDGRSDVYALGATLYHALTGRAPFDGPTALAVLGAVLRDLPEPPSRWNPAVGGELDAIALKALEKAPASRYPSAETLALDLERWPRGERVGASRPAFLDRVARSAGRWQRELAALAVLASIAGLAAAARLRTSGEGRGVEDPSGTAAPASRSTRANQLLAAAAERVERALREEQLTRASLASVDEALLSLDPRSREGDLAAKRALLLELVRAREEKRAPARELVESLARSLGSAPTSGATRVLALLRVRALAAARENERARALYY